MKRLIIILAIFIVGVFFVPATGCDCTSDPATNPCQVLIIPKGN